MKKILVVFFTLLISANQVYASTWADPFYDAGLPVVSYNLGGINHKSNAGPMGVDVYANDTGNWDLVFTSFAFCIEPSQNATGGYATVLNLAQYTKITESNLREAAWLIDTNWLPSSSQEEAAGLQLAIWEVLYDDLFGVITESDTRAAFYTDASALSYYDNFLAGFYAAINHSYAGNDFRIIEFIGDNGTKQDLITRPIPEPATMLLMGLGLIGLAGIGAKRRKIQK